MKLHITVKPKSKVDQVIIDPDGSIRVKIMAPPVDGKANKYLIEYLSEFFDISRSKLRLLKGETSSHKTIEIDLAEEIVAQKLKGL